MRRRRLPDPVDGMIAAALMNDADVQVGLAKRQLADAELTKARQAVALKVTSLHGLIGKKRNVMKAAEERFAWTACMFEKGTISQAQLLAERVKLEAAQAQLARLEAELKLITGGGVGAVPKAPADEIHRNAAARGLTCAACHVGGSAPGNTAFIWPPNHPITDRDLKAAFPLLSAARNAERAALDTYLETYLK
jgi:hypothetical protein